jgi:predicted ester cyclase
MKKVSIGLLIAVTVVGCKKKKEEENKEPAGSATAPMTTEGSAGSAGAMEGSAAAEKTMVGPELADKYQKCVGLISDNKIDDFISTCIAADYKGHDMGGTELAGPDALKGEFQSLKTAFPDWKLTPQLVIVNGRNILGVMLSQGTNSGPMKMGGQEMPATNKKFGQLMFHKLAINDQNKATEEWSYGDPMTMMAQLGLAPKGTPPMRPVLDKGWDGAPIIAVTADNDAEKKNLATVKAMVDAFNAHKPADWLAQTTDDVVESDQSDDKDVVGKKAVEQDIKMFLTGFSDAKLAVDGTWAAGDYVVTNGTFEGTNDHDMGKMKKTGKKVSIHYAEVLKLKDGKVTNVWRFRNGMEAARQLGMMPEPGAAPAAGSAAPAAPAGTPPKK